jgi:hypothetical protein
LLTNKPPLKVSGEKSSAKFFWKCLKTSDSK